MKRYRILAGIFALAFFAMGQVHGQTNITAPAAIEIALSMTGGGTVNSLELSSDATGPVYRIVVINNAIRYDVSVNAQTGEVIGLSMGPSPGAAPQQSVGTIVPRPPARQGGPANPPISAQRAVELAGNHLASIGVTNARFDYVYMDFERGRWVWSVEFDSRGRDYEFYIDVNTGEFLKAPGRGRR
ncbi:MAG: PepSY domain-containing protein [Treponema sp.]|nr:PepSY domain-containing protein [Treponema sp.]